MGVFDCKFHPRGDVWFFHIALKLEKILCLFKKIYPALVRFRRRINSNFRMINEIESCVRGSKDVKQNSQEE